MKTILIVDDSATSRLLFKAFMPQEYDVKIIEADNMDDAISQAEQYPPDIVFMDYNMPEHNGVEIAQVLQNKGVNATYILLTANTQTEVINNAKQAGFVNVLDKPVNSEKITNVIADII